MSIWLALAIGVALGGLRVMVGMIGATAGDYAPPRVLLASAGRYGAIYAAMIWAIVQGWVLAFGANG